MAPARGVTLIGGLPTLVANNYRGVAINVAPALSASIPDIAQGDLNEHQLRWAEDADYRKWCATNGMVPDSLVPYAVPAWNPLRPESRPRSAPLSDEDRIEWIEQVAATGVVWKGVTYFPMNAEGSLEAVAALRD